MKIFKQSRGFTLIEVMLALLILALGILGITKLQGTLIKNSSDANQRAVAVALAQKKIDDLKSFTELAMTGSSDWGCPAPALNAASLAYADIADNTGGAPGCAANLLANTDIPIGNTNYQLSWDVTPYQFVSNVATAMTDASSAAPTVDFKNVEVVVSWLDIDTGNDASVALSTILDSYGPAVTALSASTNAGGAPIYPTYTPEAAPDVIDIEVDTGDGTKRQTSKPLPDAVKTGANANTIVSFEVVTYQQHPLDSSKFTATRQEEYVTVDCRCTLVAANATAYPPAHTVWDDTDKERYDRVGFPISKQTAIQTNNANDVDEVCTTCCRDHHDATASPVKYVAGTTSGNHTHYKINGNGAVAGTNDEYIESCRLKLVDGVYRVFQDWNLIDLTQLERAELSDGSALQSEYRSYVDQLLKDTVESTSLATKPSLRTPLNTAVGTLNLQMESRGLYIDDVYDLSGALSSEYLTYVTDSSNADRLEKIPFAEVNLTLLSGWTSASTAVVTVRNDPVADIADPANNYYGTYERGLLDILAEAPSPGIDVTTSMFVGNEGITQNEGFGPTPSSLSDVVAVIASGTATNVNVTGAIAITSSDSSNLGGYKPVVIPGGSCSFDAVGSNNFTCTVSSGSTVTIQATAEKNNGSLSCSLVAQTLANVTTDQNIGTLTVDCTT